VVRQTPATRRRSTASRRPCLVPKTGLRENTRGSRSPCRRTAGRGYRPRDGPKPEDVLPEHRDTTSLDRKDVRTEVSVAVEHDQTGRQDRKGQQDQDRGHEHVPGENRHAEHRHARCAKVEDRRTEVDPVKIAENPVSSSHLSTDRSRTGVFTEFESGA